MNILNLKRKIVWLINALLFRLCKKMYRRNPKLWIYGVRKGKSYDDNCKYLFEYVNQRHSDQIHSVWLAENEKVIEAVKKNGGEAYKFTSKKGKAIARKAGVAIYSHGLDDFGTFPLVGGSKLIFLGHGVGFKRTYQAKYSGISLFLRQCLDKLYSYTMRDATISTSLYYSNVRRQLYGLSPNDKVIVTGQPRNDILKIIDRNKVLMNLGIDTSRKVILYMPTYRMPSMGKDAMTNIVKNLYDSNELDLILDGRNYIFIAKLHPNTPPIILPERKNFRILGYNEVEANHELLAVGDILITDYSSCCVDFALLQRPVIFYRPDEEKFFNHSERVCDEYFDISNNNSCQTPKELAEQIANPSLGATDAINALFEDPSIKGSCYSENVYRMICNEIGLRYIQ